MNVIRNNNHNIKKQHLVSWWQTCNYYLIVFPITLALCLLLTNGYGQSGTDTVRIVLKAIPGMQYDLVRFTVKPGSYLRLVLTNADDMEHNLVIGKKDSRQKIVEAATALGVHGPAVGYIPKLDLVLASIPVLKVGESDSILIRAPRNTGVYPYVCTFPGHGNIMFGAIHVTNGIMPEIMADMDIPAHRRKSDIKGQEHISSGPPAKRHPYPLVPPYYYRVLMPDAGPAAIAVCLPGNLAYCWDAGPCRLRYAWTGEFLDLTDYWTVKGELHAKILGSVFYRDKGGFPFRMNVNEVKSIAPTIKFKGYRLVNGYPEFNYWIDHVEVFELIIASKDGKGLLRQFRMKGLHHPVWFVHDKDDGAVYGSDKGSWFGTQLKLDPQEAAAFSIIMNKSGQ